MRSTLQERILVMSEESITTSLLARLFVLGVSCKMQERQINNNHYNWKKKKRTNNEITQWKFVTLLLFMKNPSVTLSSGPLRLQRFFLPHRPPSPLSHRINVVTLSTLRQENNKQVDR